MPVSPMTDAGTSFIPGLTAGREKWAIAVFMMKEPPASIWLCIVSL